MSPGILEAVAGTEPPEFWDRGAAPELFPATYFLMPRGGLQSPHGRDITVLYLFIGEKGQEYGRGHKLRPMVPMEAMCACGAYDTTGCLWYTKVPLFDVMELRKVGFKYGFHDDMSSALSDPLESERFTAGLLGIVAQFVMILRTRRELSTEPRFKKRMKKKDKEIWYPRFVGPRYRAPGADEAGRAEAQGGHVKGHWRTGHWKQQPYGKGRKLRKPVWIERYWAGAD